MHSKSPYHAFAHCKVFATAAPRRARTLISVSFSGLPLPRPVWINGLVGSYPANSLIHRRLILERIAIACIAMLFSNQTFQYQLPTKYYAQFPGFGSSQGQIIHVLLSRLPEASIALPPRLACLNRISIAVSSSRISWNYSFQIFFNQPLIFRWFFLKKSFGNLNWNWITHFRFFKRFLFA